MKIYPLKDANYDLISLEVQAGVVVVVCDKHGACNKVTPTIYRCHYEGCDAGCQTTKFKGEKMKTPLTKAKMIEAIKKRDKVGVMLAKRELKYMEMERKEK